MKSKAGVRPPCLPLPPAGARSAAAALSITDMRPSAPPGAVPAPGIWSEWLPVGLPAEQFQCRATLINGQSFAWAYDEGRQRFAGVVGRTVFRLEQSESSAPAQFSIALRPNTDRDEQIVAAKAALHDYLHAPVDLQHLYNVWVECDRRFAEIATTFTGIRLLRQDPVECLFSFICSSNNHIGRITLMLTRMREMYGEPLIKIDDITYRAFPSISSLAELEEKQLRLLGFGYRAKFIKETAMMLYKERSEDFLYSLRTSEFDVIRSELCKFVGVGRKVADCVALFSLDQHQIVPVDTHVFQIAMHHYRHRLPSMRSKPTKALSDKVYTEISAMFTDVFRERAGWAHSILFTSDLAMFKQSPEFNPRKRHRSQ